MNIENKVPEFTGFPKISRYSRAVVVTEKIDGTNAQIWIGDDGEFLTGSRNRWITPEADNYGFSRWAHDHKDELMTLGPGRHFGEWWGLGIQRRYGVPDKRWSLFNVGRWCLHGEEPRQISSPGAVKLQDVLPACVGLVPILDQCVFDNLDISYVLESLRERGSQAAPGFMNPEGVVVHHVAGNVSFKKTLAGDGVPKSKGRQ